MAVIHKKAIHISKGNPQKLHQVLHTVDKKVPMAKLDVVSPPKVQPVKLP